MVETCDSRVYLYCWTVVDSSYSVFIVNSIALNNRACISNVKYYVSDLYIICTFLNKFEYNVNSYFDHSEQAILATIFDGQQFSVHFMFMFDYKCNGRRGDFPSKALCLTSLVKIQLFNFISQFQNFYFAL